jgi:nucleoside-diphosphate-sugar epimerase
VSCITWAEAKPWRHLDDPTVIVKRFAQASESTEVDVLFANGLTDPARPVDELGYSNCELPLKIIEAMREAKGMRFLTFGTVMEEFAQHADTKRYLASKCALASGIETLAADPLYSHRLVHLRLHTLYGAEPAAHSFLGQICGSLQRNESFLMSSGWQLREFHHVRDVASSVLALCGRPWDSLTPDVLSFGRPVQLRGLAETVFADFDLSDLLKVGQLTTPSGENFEKVIPRSPEWLIAREREPMKGVIDWLAEFIGCGTTSRSDQFEALCREYRLSA